jgi:hypothetical protein
MSSLDLTKIKNDYLDLMYSNRLDIQFWEKTFQNIILWVQFFLSKAVSAISNASVFFMKNQRVTDETESVMSLIEKYADNQKKRFLNTFETNKQDHWNMNTDDVFYDLEKYNQLLMEENTELEQKWKTRILFESTPNGNVIMYYDSYKKGFSYYSDLQMNYATLNAVAMKYALVYLCRDLFVDETIVPAKNLSPLIQLEKEQEKKEREKEKEKKREENRDYGIDKEVLKSGPFAKLKNYKLEGKSNDEMKKTEITQDKSDEKWKIMSMNKFLYLGKIINFSVIQKIPKNRIQISCFKSKYSEMFDKDHENQEEVFHYRDFKKMMNMQNS